MQWQSAGLSGCLSVKLFLRQVSTPFQFFLTKRYGNITTGASNPSVYEKIAIFDQYLTVPPVTMECAC